MENVVFTNLSIPEIRQLFRQELETYFETNKQTEQPPTDQPEQLLTIQEAAEFLSLTVPTMYSKTSKGELPVMKRSKRLYFSRTELLEYLKAGRKKSNADIEKEAEQYLTNKKKGQNNV
jgi:excisionase family DNA binding protein